MQRAGGEFLSLAYARFLKTLARFDFALCKLTEQSGRLAPARLRSVRCQSRGTPAAGPCRQEAVRLAEAAPSRAHSR